MALVLADRVRETTTTAGTGTITLLGAVPSCQSFAVVGNGNTTYYTIVAYTGTEWEVGIGTYTASGTLLSRTTVLSSSNSGSLVNFSAGTKDVFVDYPASKAVYEDASGNIDSYPITGGTINGTTVGATTPAAGTFTTLNSTSTATLGGDATNPSLVAAAVSSPTRWLQISGSSAGNVTLSVQGIGTPNLILQNRSTGSINFATNSASNVQAVVSHTASAVNYVQVTGAATGNDASISALGSDSNIWLRLDGKGNRGVAIGYFARIGRSFANYFEATGNNAGSSPILSVGGSDTNIDLNLTTKGTGVVNLNTGSGTQVRIIDSGGTAVNRIHLQGQATGFLPVIASRGSDTNLGMSYSTQGTGAHDFYTAGTNFTQQVKIAHTASAVNYVQVTGAATGGQVFVNAAGSDSNIGIGFTAKLFANTTFFAAGGFTQFQVGATASSANYFQAKGGATGFGAVLSAQGSDTNIPAVVQPKGTGALQAQQTDSTATGGNARGANAVDWQTSRNNAAMVASGINATIGGGNLNRASSTYTVVAGGNNNVASAFGSLVVGGNANTSSGAYSFVGAGEGNIASNYPSAVVAGALNTAAGLFNFIGGGYINSATSAIAVTTQSATMNGTTAVTLSGSNASIKVGQYISGTSIASQTYVAAISGTSLTLSQAASGSSTSTLSFFTPHGVVVGGGNNQATGSYSFIGGGGDAGTAANRNVASGAWSFVGGGMRNTASGLGAVVVGGGDGTSTYANTASNTGSFVGGGISNTSTGLYATVVNGGLSSASGQYAFVGGGYFNGANGGFSTVAGGAFGSARSITGNTVFSASFLPIAFASGVSQAALLVLARQTTDATATVLASDGNAAGSTNQVILPNNSAYFFTGEIISGVTGGGNTKGWTIEGVIKRGANAAATTLVGSTVTSMFADVGAATWTIGLTADTINGGLAVTFTGQAATTIRTVAQIRTTEMTY